MTADTLELYADYVCPFCYVGRQVLDQVFEGQGDPPTISWHPFDLRANRRNQDGEIVVEEPQDESYFEQAWQNVERLADEYGVPTPEQADRDIDSRAAQRVGLFVREEFPDRWWAFDERVYRVHWQEGRDISDPAVLGEIAEEAGLPADIHRRALSDEAVESRLESAFAQAREDGVTGVPTFVYGNEALRGAVPSRQLRALIDRSSPAEAPGNR